MKIALFEGPAKDRPMAALGLLLMGVSFLALQDSMIKMFAPATTFWQFQAIRSVFNLIFILFLAKASIGIGQLWPNRPWPVFMRALMLTCCMLFFFGAAPQISVSQMAAGLYTYPFFITLMAGPFLGEAIGPWRLAALGLGMAGAFTVLDPLAEGFRWVQIMPVIAGFFYALNLLILRRWCRNESPLAIAFIVALVFIIFGTTGGTIISSLPLAAETRSAVPFLLNVWPEISLAVLGFCLFASCLNLTGNICLSRAYQTADSSWLAPADFSYLLFVAIWSRVFYETWPTPQAATGMAMIALAGGVTALRERLRSRVPPALEARQK
ncbi:DMT family transporter [Alphaproteobacteria bacterium LSUCC0684]